MSERYDKWILTLSGGALAISLTFMEKFVKTPEPSSIWLIGLSWFFFLVTIIAALVSFLTSQSAMRCARQILDDSLGKPPAPEPKNCFSCWTHKLNIISMVTFFIGVILLCAFAISNMPKGAV